MASAAAPATAARAGTVAVLLAKQGSEAAAIATAVAIAAEHRARIAIFAVPHRAPLGAYGVALGCVSAPFNAVSFRAEALVDAEAAARSAAARVPPEIPAEYAVAPESPARALARLIERTSVAHVVVDQAVLVRQRRLRRALGRLRRDGMPLDLV